MKENRIERVGFDSYRLNSAQSADIGQTSTDAHD